MRLLHVHTFALLERMLKVPNLLDSRLHGSDEKKNDEAFQPHDVGITLTRSQRGFRSAFAGLFFA